ncbi:hypothetical protein PRIPAC_76931, partial [Pristionchus pacificus]
TGRLVSERAYKVYSCSTALCSIPFNSVIIYGFIYTQVKHVGPYRWLLLSFAVLNILISILHALVFPEVYGIDLFASNLPGYIALAYWIPHDGKREWQWTPIVSMLSACTIVFTALIVIFYCLIRIRRQMNTVAQSSLPSLLTFPSDLCSPSHYTLNIPWAELAL